MPYLAPCIRVTDLTKSYSGFTVVDSINFTVNPGECLGVLGPNGAGKTTTMRMLLGLTQPDAGDIEVMGFQIPQQSSAMRAVVGLVPQEDNLDPDFTVEENLLTYASYFGIPKRAAQSKIPELLKFASLAEKKSAHVESLSGGMKRRLTIARSLINDPACLILDEPTTGLDPQARQVIWRRLRSLITQERTLILTTHYMEEAQRLCDRILLMDHGQILDIDTPKRLIEKHIEPHVIEVHGDNLCAWLAKAEELPMARHEQVGATLFCYTENEKPIIDALSEYADLEYHHRRANLEDVFLKITGRDLRDG